MTDDPDKVIRIINLINGPPTAFDGQFVVEYDPGRDGIEPATGEPMMAHLVTTPERAKATRYPGTDAIELWRSVDPRQPLRPDGRPNRPLTAFSVSIEPAEGN